MGVSVKIQKMSLLIKHRYAIFFLVFSLLYHFFSNQMHFWEIGNIVYPFYAVDFDCGFATRLLPGAVFHVLFGSYATQHTATFFVAVVIVLFFMGIAVLLEKILQQVPIEYRHVMFFLLILFVSGGFTFSLFTKALGLLDFYWLLCSLLFFFFVSHKWLRFLIPLLYACMILIHNGAMISYIIFVSIVLMFHISFAANKKEKKAFTAILMISICVAVGMFLFFLFNESNMICSKAFLHQKMNEYNCNFYDYFDYVFYNIFQGENINDTIPNEMDSFVQNFFVAIFYRIQFNIVLLKKNMIPRLIEIIYSFFVLFPLLCCFYRFYLRYLRQEGNILKRICIFFLLMQFPFTFFFGILFSEDVTRWMTHAFLLSFSGFLVFLYYEKELQKVCLEYLRNLWNTPGCKVYCLMYLSISFFE